MSPESVVNCSHVAESLLNRLGNALGSPGEVLAGVGREGGACARAALARAGRAARRSHAEARRGEHAGGKDWIG